MQSTRLPKKMILDVCGIPLIIHTAKQALKSNATDVIVATDHEDIFCICQKYKINAIMTSDKHTSGTDRLAEVVKKLNFHDDEIIINVQGDEPLIEPELINALADFIIKKGNPIATIAHPITEDVFNPNIVKVVMDIQQNALYFSRAPIPYYRDGYQNIQHPVLPSQLSILRHIGIYAYSVDFLKKYTFLSYSPVEAIENLEQLRALYHGYKIAVLTTTHPPKPGVTLNDMSNLLPDYANIAIREAIVEFNNKIHGFSMYDAVLTGVETRTSSPVRIKRGNDYQSINIRGLYPAGEGAGYAGGILSAGVDGIKVAEAIATAILSL